MLEKNITLIVGAGASADLGLPVGEALKFEISKWLYHQLDKLDRNLMPPAFEKIFAESSGQSQIYGKLKFIAENVKRAASIDNFLDNNRTDEELVKIGKLAIASIISMREDLCPISETELRHKSWEDDGNYFLSRFLRMVVSGHTADNVAQSLSKIRFIIFNYDRCVERYIDLWLSNNFGVSFNELIKTHIEFVHVYGELGNYFDMNRFSLRTNPVGKHPTVHARSTLMQNEQIEMPPVATRLKIFTEQENSITAMQIDNCIATTDVLVFLGFAFEPQNMKLLSLKNANPISSVFATAYGVSKSDRDEIDAMLRKKFCGKGRPVLISNKDQKCKDLFYEFSFSLRRELGVS